MAAVSASTGESTSSSSNPALNTTTFQRGRSLAPAEKGMTAAGTYLKAGFLLLLVILGGILGWSEVEIITFGGEEIAVAPSWTWGVMFLTFIVGVIGVMSYRAAPIAAIVYALLEGTTLGIIAAFYDIRFDGIVMQAVIVTVCIFASMLVLYLSGLITVTQGLVRFVIAAMGGLLMLYLFAWIFSLFGVNFAFWNSPTPLGIALSAGIVLLGAFNLPLDFEFIKQASQAGAPKFMEWYGAFGLMLSVIWIYIEVLRLLALLARSRR